MNYRHSTLTEAAIIAGFYESRLDEGLGDFLKKAVDKVKNISSAVKNYMLSKADAISAWTDKNIVEPLKKHLLGLVPGYSFGSNKSNDEGLISSVIQLMAKKNGVATESIGRVSERKAQRLGEGVQRYVEQVSSSFIFEKRTVIESGAIGAVLSVIHWSHFSIDVLEAILKVAPSIPFLAGLINKLKEVEKFMKNNPKLSKALDWYEHGKIGSLNAKDVINAVCIAVGIVEIIAGGGVWIILSTVGSAAWVIGEKIWHHYQKADKDAAAIKESFIRNSNRFSESRSSRFFREEEDIDIDDEIDELDDDLEDDDIEVDPDEEDDILLTPEDDTEDIDLEDDEDCDIDDEDELDAEYEGEDDDEEEDVVTESRIRRLERAIGRSSMNESRRFNQRSRY